MTLPDPSIVDDEDVFAVPVRKHIADAVRDRRGLVVVGLLVALILFAYGAMA